jgi:RHS repeat-associated protein
MSPRETILCRYRYDSLDRSVDWALDQQDSIQRFYCKSRLATEIQGAAKCSLVHHDDHALAQQRHIGDKVDTALLATDQPRSVLHALDATQPHHFAYTPYGHRQAENQLLSRLGFNGERPDPVTGCYHLGGGYRQFNPKLMRFNNPDTLSPFGKGGMNAYAYCGGDPVNRVDETGHFFKAIGKFLGFRPNAASVKAKKINSTIGNYVDPGTSFFINTAAVDAGFTSPRTVTTQAIAKNNKLYIVRTARNNAFEFKTETPITLHKNLFTEYSGKEKLTNLGNTAKKGDDIDYLTRVGHTLSQSPNGLTKKQVNAIKHSSTKIRETNEAYLLEDMLNKIPRRGFFDLPISSDRWN